MRIEDVKAANVTIKKGQGVTHSLKDLVKKLNLPLSDGNISKDEWKATIKVLDSIQQQRISNGKSAIFGENYLVDEGDEINFTADEMKKIYTAMGVEFNSDDSIKPKPEPKPEPKPKPSPKPPSKSSNKLTPGERNKARHYGSNVADYLVGYTDDSEKGLTKEVITKHVNSRNVLDFLSGYENNRGLGDNFFEQFYKEYGFEEKQNLMKNVAVKLSQYLKANGQPHLAREINVALADNGFSMSEIKKLDQIVQTMLTTVPGLKV